MPSPIAVSLGIEPVVEAEFLSALYAAILSASSTMIRSHRLRRRLSFASSTRETHETLVI
jgi:hypothetical protein